MIDFLGIAIAWLEPYGLLIFLVLFISSLFSIFRKTQVRLWEIWTCLLPLLWANIICLINLSGLIHAYAEYYPGSLFHPAVRIERCFHFLIIGLSQSVMLVLLRNVQHLISRRRMA